MTNDSANSSTPRERGERKALRKDIRAAGLKGGVEGAKAGGKAASVVPGLGTVTGTAIGAGVASSMAQAKVAREAGDPKMAFCTGLGVGGVAGGVINAKRAAEVRRANDIDVTSVPQPAEPKTEAGKKLPVRQRLSESKVGQVVRSESFREGARRIGAEAIREATGHAVRAHGAGTSGKAMAAGAARSAASAALRAGHAELTNNERGASEKSAATPANSTDSGIVSRLGAVVAGHGSKGKSDRRARETQDRQFDQRAGADGEQPGFGD